MILFTDKDRLSLFEKGLKNKLLVGPTITKYTEILSEKMMLETIVLCEIVGNII